LSDTPFVVSALFSKTVQTAPYESEKAEVSAQFQVAEGVDAGKAIESGMSMVKTQVLVALGKVEGTLKAMSTTGEAPAVKRGPGRPKKEETQPETPTQVIPDKKTEEDANPKKVEEEDFDFSDEPKKGAREITDQELQAACSEAAKVITAGVVKGVFQTKYGAARVSLIKANERQTFLDDLKTLMANKKAEG
jgi:hypothetical protein